MSLTRSIAAGYTVMALLGGAPADALGQTGVSAASDAQRTIEVTAEQFRFVPSRIEVVQGEAVRLRLRAVDVPHGLSIRDLGVTAMARPGQETVVDFVAENPGEFPFDCHVFCGAGHARMVGTLVVLPASGREPADRPGAGAAERLDPLEPDFSLVSLPTTLGLPANRVAFRLVHRFSRPLDGGPGYGHVLEDLFGLDSPAQIGLEFRYGLAPRLQVGIHRNNSRNIQLFGRFAIMRSSDTGGTGLDAVVSVEGLDNFRDEHAPVFGAVLSQRLGSRVAVYLEPMWVENADNEAILHPQTAAFHKSDDDAFVLGLGTRIRILETVSIVAELLPRLHGFDQGEEYVAFAVEKQAGGHVFQLNVSNSVGTTPAQLAQGASTNWFIGFNITRRFF